MTPVQQARFPQPTMALAGSRENGSKEPKNVMNSRMKSDAWLERRTAHHNVFAVVAQRKAENHDHNRQSYAKALAPLSGTLSHHVADLCRQRCSHLSSEIDLTNLHSGPAFRQKTMQLPELGTAPAFGWLARDSLLSPIPLLMASTSPHCGSERSLDGKGRTNLWSKAGHILELLAFDEPIPRGSLSQFSLNDGFVNNQAILEP